MEILISSVIGGIAVVSVWATYYLNRRARLRSELPKIYINFWSYRYAGKDRPGLVSFGFELGTDHNSVGWDVIRVEVNRARGTRCLLASAEGEPEWRESHDFAEPVNKGLLRIQNAQGAGWLTFICQHPLKRVGKYRKKKVPVPYVDRSGLSTKSDL